MKKYYFLSKSTLSVFLLFVLSPIFSQVGVNTNNPQETLHVNGTARVTNTENVTTSTKMLGVDSRGTMTNITVGNNLQLNNNVLTANVVVADISKYKLATFSVPTTSTNQNFDLDLDLNGINIDKVIFRLTATHNFSVRSLIGGSEGRHVILYNASNVNMSIIDDYCPVGPCINTIDTIGTSTSTSGVGTVELVYDSIASKWIVINIRD